MNNDVNPSYCLTQRCEVGEYDFMGKCTGNYLSLEITLTKILACQEGCTSCTSNYCQMCDMGYYKVDGQCTKISCIADCDVCETSTICRKCNEKSFLSGDKTECLSNFIDINKLFKIIKGCEDVIPNCKVCETQDVCEECKDTHFWDGNDCLRNCFFGFSLFNNLSL